MSPYQPVIHGTFSIERLYSAPPARVFAAWAEPALKLRWFVCGGDWLVHEHSLDFRAGGRERLSVGPAGGSAHVFDATYHDVLAERRIIYAYDMYVGSERISISLSTIEFEPRGKGTRMLFTEQGAFFNGERDAKERAEGTRIGLDNLAVELGRSRV